jgi:HNH endonuclease
MKIQKQIKHSIIEYDSITGDFIWILAYKKHWMIGEIATHETPNGYLYIKAGGKNHSASRLAIELTTGKPVPDDMVVDHINRNTRDNRETNLQVITKKENNAKAVPILGASGIRGVSYFRKLENGDLYRARLGNRSTYHYSIEAAMAGYAKLVEEKCKS